MSARTKWCALSKIPSPARVAVSPRTAEDKQTTRAVKATAKRVIPDLRLFMGLAKRHNTKEFPDHHAEQERAKDGEYGAPFRWHGSYLYPRAWGR